MSSWGFRNKALPGKWCVPDTEPLRSSTLMLTRTVVDQSQTGSDAVHDEGCEECFNLFAVNGDGNLDDANPSGTELPSLGDW